MKFDVGWNGHSAYNVIKRSMMRAKSVNKLNQQNYQSQMMNKSSTLVSNLINPVL